MKKGPWKDDGCKGKTSTERDRNRNGPGGQKGPLWGPFGGPGAFAQGPFRPKAPKWKLQFYEAFGYKYGFWALPGDAEIRAFRGQVGGRNFARKTEFSETVKNGPGGPRGPKSDP